ncbi:MAG: hypothetical protein IPO21_19755 [Bacteroidales bacterium]|nr:hypothetical protein [Bacteroidales bacterium]
MKTKRTFLLNFNKLLVLLLSTFGLFQACEKADPFVPDIVPMYGIRIESHAGVTDSIVKPESNSNTFEDENSTK